MINIAKNFIGRPLSSNKDEGHKVKDVCSLYRLMENVEEAVIYSAFFIFYL